MDKIKVLWISDLVTETGFGRVAHSVIKFLDKNKYDITGLGVNYWGDPHSLPIKVYPASTPRTPMDFYGFQRLEFLLKQEKFDLIFILNDAWVLANYFETIKKIFNNETGKIPPIVVYTPVDAKNHDVLWYKDFDIATKVVTYTNFAKNTITECAPFLEEKMLIIPHGVDTELFYRMDAPKKELRKELFGENKRFEEVAESFIFLNANRNQIRKRLDITMAGFAEFKKAYPTENVKLYMHCGVVDAHIDVIKYAKYLGILEDLIVTNTQRGVQNVPIDFLNLIYNATNAGISTTLGEGWGLTNIEHAITGAPQILPRHSACEEVFSDCGLMMDVEYEQVLSEIGTIGGLVSPKTVAESMNTLYTNKKLYGTLSKLSISKFSQEKYSWKKIAEEWDKVFESVLR